MTRPTLPPLVIVRDTAEPYEHDRAPDPVTGRCALCGGLRACEPVFVPRVFASGIPRGTPYADWPRVAVPTVRGNLDVGDYSLPGLRCTFERKSGPDLLATLFGEVEDSVGESRANQERLRAELERGKAGAWEPRAIIVEASVAWLYEEARRRYERWGRCFDPPRALGILRAFAIDLGWETVWCGTKGSAELEVGDRLARVWSQATNGPKAKDARRRGYSMPWLGALDGVVPEAAE